MSDDYGAQIKGSLSEIRQLDPVNGPKRAAEVLAQLYLTIKDEYDWLCIEQLRGCAAASDRDFSEAHVRSLWELLVQASHVATRHRRTKEWANPTDNRIALQDYLLERKGVCALADFGNGRIRGIEPDDPALRILLEEWVYLLTVKLPVMRDPR